MSVRDDAHVNSPRALCANLGTIARHRYDCRSACCIHCRRQPSLSDNHNAHIPQLPAMLQIFSSNTWCFCSPASSGTITYIPRSPQSASFTFTVIFAPSWLLLLWFRGRLSYISCQKRWTQANVGKKTWRRRPSLNATRLFITSRPKKNVSILNAAP